MSILMCFNECSYTKSTLAGSSPIRSVPYRIPQRLEEEVNKEVEKMLEMGIIRPSTSPGAAPVVFWKIIIKSNIALVFRN